MEEGIIHCIHTKLGLDACRQCVACGHHLGKSEQLVNLVRKRNNLTLAALTLSRTRNVMLEGVRWQKWVHDS